MTANPRHDHFYITPSSTTVCICHDKNTMKQIDSGDLWPIPVRGSKYQIQFSDTRVDYVRSNGPGQFEPVVVKEAPGNEKRRIGMKRLKEFSPGPLIADETVELIARVRNYKNGPITLTARGEAIVWRKDTDGWNPYYVGKANVDPVWHQYPERMNHPQVNGLFPSELTSGSAWFTPKEWSIWTGCMFKTGEPWTVRIKSRGTGILTWPGSIRNNLAKGLVILGTEDKHHQLVDAYLKIRPSAGRMYVLMGGHVWINLRKSDLRDNEDYTADEMWSLISDNTLEVLSSLNDNPNHPLMQMFNARMEATKGDGELENACMPIYLGNCEDFDDGSTPITRIVSGYKRSIRDPNRIEGDEDDPYSSREERDE